MAQSEADLKFDKLYKIAVTCMRLNRSHPAVPKNCVWVMQFIPMFLINMTCFYFLFYSVVTHDIRTGNYTEACKNITIVLIFMNTNIKYIVLIYYQESINDLIRIIEEDYEIAKTLPENEKQFVLKRCKDGNFVCKLWLVCAASASGVFPLKAMMLNAQSYINKDGRLYLMFDVTFPFGIDPHKDEIPVFITLFTIAFLFGVFAATMFIGFDPLIPIFTLHVTGQLEVLSARMYEALSPANSKEQCERNLNSIIKKLQDLYSFVERCQTNFKILNEFNMKTSTIVIPLSGFQIVEYLRVKKINIEFITLYFGAILTFFMPCYFNNLLMDTSEKFREAIYFCGWEKRTENSIRTTILFMLTKASKPVVISTIFYAISLNTFADMCHQSYTLFNLMNAAWAK